MLSIEFLLSLLLTAGTAELSGRVVDSDDQPVAGAIVVVSTAKPRVGPATTCPSCYRDCTKRTTTDENGAFSITDLSDQLLFSLAAGGSGYQGQVSEHFDPQQNPEIKFELEPLQQAEKIEVLRGRVVDLDGTPIAGAQVRPHTIFRNNGTGSGSDRSVTPLTLTDEDGVFEMSVGDHIEWMDLRINASAYAPAQTRWARSEDQKLEISLGSGAGLRGKLVFRGQPVVGVEVGLVQKNRMMGSIVTPQELFTDQEGTFSFDQLPPELEYTVYTHTGQAASAVLPLSLIKAPRHGERADLGEIPAVQPRRLEVTVTTSDGTPIPKDSYVYIGRQYGWRGSQLPLEQKSTSKVSILDAAPELYQVALRTKGYEVLETQPKLNVDLNQSYTVDASRESSVVFILRPTGN
ncbi:Nickel uptake substrate-specific transmembrane region [Stieleria maiorica]|uniref:Nickel uptake substrate-specific transmembrane region n=1 Tax=Stieleria maiorica TaxID=2795974 RepID=A0A5B9MQQ6_9BACT|nr:carboxypeptidase regulatory-like domain-containing protein [Stieleria maiorica]QEG01348.1 Nickel uptake substrate-specific transmembrane region [Stieleria maiorica]